MCVEFATHYASVLNIYSIQGSRDWGLSKKEYAKSYEGNNIDICITRARRYWRDVRRALRGDFSPPRISRLSLSRLNDTIVDSTSISRVRSFVRARGSSRVLTITDADKRLARGITALFGSLLAHTLSRSIVRFNRDRFSSDGAKRARETGREVASAKIPPTRIHLRDDASRDFCFQGRHKRNATFPGGQTTILQVTPTIRSKRANVFFLFPRASVVNDGVIAASLGHFAPFWRGVIAGTARRDSLSA